MDTKDKIPYRYLDKEYDGRWQPCDNYNESHINPNAVRAGFAYKVGGVHQVAWLHDHKRTKKLLEEEGLR